MADFIRLVDVLKNDEEITIVVESIYRGGIFRKDGHSSNSQIVPPWFYLEAGRKDWSFGIFEVLDLLAQYQDDVADGFLATLGHEEFIKINSTFSDFGWPIDKVPKFEEIRQELLPTLISLHSLLFGAHKHLGIEYMQLAWQIETNGIYVLDQSGATTTKHSADSKAANYALVGLSVYYDYSTRDWPDRESDPYGHNPEDDPTYIYGWPKDNLPEFESPNDEERPQYLDCLHKLKYEFRTAFFKPDLYTVGRLFLLNKATPAMVTNAIEKEGIYGYDKVGRLEWINPSLFSDFFGAAFGLKTAIESYAKPLVLTGRYELNALEDVVFANYGWPKEMLPDFKVSNNNLFIINDPSQMPEPSQTHVIESEKPEKHTKAGAMTKHEKQSYMTLVAGLLWFIQGRLGNKKHPEYTKEAPLIRTLLKEMENVAGAGERFLKDTFRDVKALEPQKFTQEAMNRHTESEKEDG